MPKKKARILEYSIAFATLILPFLIINIFTHFNHEIVGRIISLSIFYLLMPILVLNLIFSPSSKALFIGPKAKRTFTKTNIKRLVLFQKSAFCIFSFLFIVFVSSSFIQDTQLITKDFNGSVLEVEGEIQSNSGAFMGLWFLSQNINFDTPHTNDNTYNLMYSFETLKPGNYYKLKILPHSKTIVEFTKIEE